jgi:hypothetical protein
LSQKGQDRRTLYRSATELHGDLRGRARSGHPAHLPARAGMVQRRSAHKGAARVQPRPREGVGLWSSAHRRRKGADSLTSRSRNTKGYLRLLERIQKAIPKGLIYLIADNLTTHKSGPVREWQEKHSRLESTRSSRREPPGSTSSRYGGASLQAPGFSWAVLRRWIRDRPSDEGRHPAVERQSEPVGVGTTTQTAEASEAHFCLPPLRNGALGTWVNKGLALVRRADPLGLNPCSRFATFMLSAEARRRRYVR